MLRLLSCLPRSCHITVVRILSETLLATTLAACASVSATKEISPTDLSLVRVGADREKVESVLGPTLMTQSAGDLTIDTYEYDKGKSAQDFDESGFAAEVLFLPWQPLIWAAVAESRGAQKGTLTITYDGNNRVVKLDPILEEERQKLNERVRQAFCGGATSQYMAGYEQHHGIGVPPNKVRAYFWYSLSASNGRAEAEWQSNTLEEAMTPEEIAQAEERLRTWNAPDCEVE